MKLINYLNSNFLTRQQLLAMSGASEQDLCEYQKQELMPTASYTLSLLINVDSFFGLHSENENVEYYAKGYVSWLGVIQSLKTRAQVYDVFSNRYIKAIEGLKQQGHRSSNPKVNSDIALHIEDEWKHFLDGTYGLCTQMGLPEDIAAKEFAIIQIGELSEKNTLNDDETKRLAAAVNLLDQASSQFAPHERAGSSRQRFVNEPRRKYGLPI